MTKTITQEIKQELRGFLSGLSKQESACVSPVIKAFRKHGLFSDKALALYVELPEKLQDVVFNILDYSLTQAERGRV